MRAGHSCCCWIVSFLLLIPFATSSSGDASETFKDHFRLCRNDHCSSLFMVNEFEKVQPFYLRLLGWDCIEECKHISMWQTVENLQQKNLEIPQFFGKWPFLRIIGIQEPASMLFSLLNGFGHLYMIRKLRSQVPRNAPMYYAWHIYSLISMHAWFWSTIFHTRDTIFTEKMDYFSAFSLNLSGIFMISWRSIALRNHGDINLKVVLGSAAGLVLIFWRHVSYLSRLKRFDYGYNMKVNLLMGLINTVWWIGWSLRNIRRKPYLQKPVICVLAANLLLLLELGDFPPLLWTFDAHSLWHAGTFPLIFVWYSYCITDCKHLDSSTKSLPKTWKS
ncbi:post-GPI attachment to proteins factor 3-like isoform X1 [Apostichopus japonicus]|uniref:post-GPI attachment to proteins factor 3-like isoform X1 n=1 Tax=Stichopus japonicus TaxID=307972 RepID=UPI003AB3F362